METRKLIISGYYGFGNSGDEAVLWSVLQALEEAGAQNGIPLQPVVLSADPAHTSRLYGVEAVSRTSVRAVLDAVRGADGLISGGGSLLQDVTGPKTIPYYLGLIRLAQLYGKPTFIYAQGIGPVRRPLLRSMVGRVLRKCTYVSVRDPASADLLAQLGLDREYIEVVPDPVVGAPGPERAHRADDDGKPPLVGVSVRFWNSDHSELRAVATALREVAARRDIRIRLLPFHPPGDVEAARHVRERLLAAESPPPALAPDAVDIATPGEHPEAMMQEVAACDLLVGMRLHSLIYGAARRVPLVGISYDPKVDAFMSQLDAAPSCHTDRPDAAQLAADISARLAEGPAWVEERKALLSRLHKESARPAQQICQFFRI